MVKVTLSLWDIAGQERFNFFKSDFYRGVAAVGLVFDLARPDTFDKVDEYFNEIRERSGNIPIILVGNKSDLKESVGETIPRKKIIDKMNQFNLLEYVETSALTQDKVKFLFSKLSIIALCELRPRLGEIESKKHFRFKVLLTGPAAVGKSSLINAFVDKAVDENYKLTIGLDFMTQEFDIPDELLPSEVHQIIKRAIKKYKKFKKLSDKEEVKKPKRKAKKVEEKRIPFEATIPETEIPKLCEDSKQTIFKNKYFYLALSPVAVFIIVIVLIQFLP
jgi:GTPase SAR1 family protein